MSRGEQKATWEGAALAWGARTSRRELSVLVSLAWLPSHFMFNHPVRAGGGAQGEMGAWRLSLLQASCPSWGLQLLTVWGEHTLPAPLQGQQSIPFFTPQGCPLPPAVTPGGD